MPIRFSSKDDLSADELRSAGIRSYPRPSVLSETVEGLEALEIRSWGELVAWGDPAATLAATLERIMDGAELLTCIAGDQPPLGQDDVEARVPEGVEVEYHEGGQPAWWWLLCAE